MRKVKEIKEKILEFEKEKEGLIRLRKDCDCELGDYSYRIFDIKIDEIEEKIKLLIWVVEGRDYR